MTNGFICADCQSQFFSAAVESIKDCPTCKSSNISRLVPEKAKWVCSHCGTELFNNADFAGVVCINCKIGRMGPSPAPDEINDFLKELDGDLSAFEEAMGLEPGDLKDDDSTLKLEPILENCFSCSNDCDGCKDQEDLDKAIKGESKPPSPALEQFQKDMLSRMEKKVDNALYPWNKTPSKQRRPKVNRGPREYCRWCTHWTRKAECYGYCRKHDVVRNAFQHCIGFFRNQWAKDKITRW
jgi:hypothetical protein